MDCIFPMPPPFSPRQPAPAAMHDRTRRWLIPLIVAFAFLMEQLDATIITTAIPDMARDLQVTPLLMSLAITSYVLSLAVFMPVSSWFADRYGARRVFAAALALFTLGSAFCGLATSLPALVATRVLQGFGGAMMTPVGRLVLLRSFPRSELVTVMAYMGSRHRTGRIARFAARTGNAVRPRVRGGLVSPGCAAA